MTSLPELSDALLRELVRSELERGNTIAHIETGWSRMDTVVRFARPLDLSFLPSAVDGGAARLYEYTDPRTGRETGIVAGREAVTGPSRT